MTSSGHGPECADHAKQRRFAVVPQRTVSADAGNVDQTSRANREAFLLQWNLCVRRLLVRVTGAQELAAFGVDVAEIMVIARWAETCARRDAPWALLEFSKTPARQPRSQQLPNTHTNWPALLPSEAPLWCDSPSTVPAILCARSCLWKRFRTLDVFSFESTVAAATLQKRIKGVWWPITVLLRPRRIEQYSGQQHNGSYFLCLGGQHGNPLTTHC